MDELALRRGLIRSLGEDPDSVAHARSAELRNGKANVDVLREFERREI